MLKEIAAETWFWAGFGALAWAVFYTRFYVQWVVSELKGRSVVPISFWYQSAVGSLLLLVWAWHTQSPLGALSQTFNLIPYSRNLVHIWRERGRLSKSLHFVTHAVVIFVVIAAVAVLAYTAWREYNINQEASAGEARRAWFWLSVGVLGQILFAVRTLVQWISTERQRKSVVPAAFWYISILAATLQFLAFAARGGGEWLYAVGMVATALIYLRNIWFIHRDTGTESPQGDERVGSRLKGT